MHSTNIPSPYFIAIEFVGHLGHGNVVAEVTFGISNCSGELGKRREALAMVI